MSYDVLIVASDSRSTTNFSHLDFGALRQKYSLDEADWKNLVDGEPLRWRVDGTEMIMPAVELFLRSGRRLPVSEEEKRRYFQDQRELEVRFLNGIYLADFLVKRGYSVEVLNSISSLYVDGYRELDALLALEPRVVALSTSFIPNRRRVVEIARRIKDIDPSITVIVGGPLPRYSWMIRTEQPELAELDLLRQVYFFMGDEPEPCPVIDAIVVDGRGEQTLARILDRIQQGRTFTDLPNIAHYDGQHRLTVNPLEPEKSSIEDDQIDWEHLDEKYLGSNIALRGSLGCPLRCKFCSFVVLYPDWELKSVDFLEAELRKISQRNIVRQVCFVDDNLFLRRDQVDRYTRMMARGKFGFDWTAFIRADSVTRENVDWIAQSRGKNVLLGLESGSRQILKNMRKVQRPERVLETVALLNERDISTLSTFIVGFPGETSETVDRTIELLNGFHDSGPGLNWYNAWVHAVLPLTPADRERERWQLEGYLCDWQHETMNVVEAHRQIRRVFREVERGAYIGYPHEDLSRLRALGGHDAIAEALKVRQRLAVIDEIGGEPSEREASLEALEGLFEVRQVRA